MKRLFTTAIYILCVILTTSGNTNEKTLTMMFKQLSISEGLSNNSVRSIFRDSRGFLWIGTESGLNKYDGYSFHQYYQSNSGLSDDAIFEVFEGPQGNIWIKTANEYSIYDYKTGKISNDYKSVLEKKHIPSKNIQRIGMTPRNEFWAYNRSKLYLQNEDKNPIKVFPLQTEKISNISICSTVHLYNVLRRRIIQYRQADL